MDCAIEISDLRKSFNGSPILDSLDLEVHPGERVGILGDNGSGKTTLLKCISGELKAETGVITVGGKIMDLGSPREARRHGIATVSQFPELAGELSALENAFFLNEPCKEGRIKIFSFERARTLLSKALQQVSHNPIDIDLKVARLSGGQKKAIAIARLLLREPIVALLDEPAAALGVEQQNKLSRLLNSEEARKTSWLIVAHDAKFLAEICDRILVMRDGKLAEYA